jgi:hypothetical protein
MSGRADDDMVQNVYLGGISNQGLMVCVCVCGIYKQQQVLATTTATTPQHQS